MCKRQWVADLNELRQEGEEENRKFGVENIEKNSGCDNFQGPLRGGGWFNPQRAVIPERHDRHIEKVDNPKIFERIKYQGTGMKNGGETKDGRREMRNDPEGAADCRENTGTMAAGETCRQCIENAGARCDHHDQRRKKKAETHCLPSLRNDRLSLPGRVLRASLYHLLACSQGLYARSILGNRCNDMSRARRLLDLIQSLRAHRRPVSATRLAEELGVSPRTLYRDIATLREQGAAIDGEPGVGYVLKPGFMLPPLMFLEEEIEALVLGSRFVAARADAPLRKAAKSALAKISAVLPRDLKERLEGSPLLVGPAATAAGPTDDLPAIRDAIRHERKLHIRYHDGQGKASQRVIWPFAMAFFDSARVVVAWCEKRQGYRHFRVDRMVLVDARGGRYPRRRQVLLKEWREQEQIPPQ